MRLHSSQGTVHSRACMSQTAEHCKVTGSLLCVLDVTSHRVLRAQSVAGQVVTALATARVAGQLIVLFGTGTGQVCDCMDGCQLDCVLYVL